MQVLEEHGDWLKVLIQARPNHTEGWVKASDVDVTSTTYKMELSLADRHLTVYDGDTVVAETDVVIGKDTTPTPVGSFYLSEKIQQKNPGGAYGPWILSTNGYSEALDLFDNGLPVIAFHGTNQPALIGTQASNGCIRMPNDVVTHLAEMLPAGTPIEIHAESLKATAPARLSTAPPSRRGLSDPRQWAGASAKDRTQDGSAFTASATCPCVMRSTSSGTPSTMARRSS